MRIAKSFARAIICILAIIAPAQAQSKLSAFNAFDTQSAETIDHALWGDFLSRYVSTTPDNRTVVAYGKVSAADHEALKDYLSALQRTDPTTLNKDEAFAYWVNFYNALTIDVILDEYPVKSILRIFSGLQPGPWKKRRARVNNVKISLDNIEHGILRKFWTDNRVHYAVNCASYGCPNLATRPYASRDLDAMLNESAYAFINHPRAIKIENGKATASSIYKWFKEDFGGEDDKIIAHLRLYANTDLSARLKTVSKIHDYDYDWSLNEAAAEVHFGTTTKAFTN